MNFQGKTLIQAIGNPLRSDDGLGPRLVESLNAKEKNNPVFCCEWIYQLQPEHAEQWSKFDRIILIDAHVQQEHLLCEKKISTENTEIDLRCVNSHSLSAETVINLCASCFTQVPEVLMLSLKGENFDLGEKLSPTAEQSFNEALKWFQEIR